MTRTVLVAAILLGLTALVIVTGCEERPALVVVVNSGSVDIEDGTVSVCGESADVGHIAVGGSDQFSINPTCEAHFDVNLKLSDGETRSAQVGYVAPGLPMRNEIIVGDGQMMFEATELE